MGLEGWAVADGGRPRRVDSSLGLVTRGRTGWYTPECSLRERLLSNTTYRSSMSHHQQLPSYGAAMLLDVP